MRARHTNRRRRVILADKLPLTFGLAAVVLAGQRLRADETVAPITVALNYAAKWTQAKGGPRVARIR